MTSLFDRVMKTPKPTITFTWIPTAYISNPLAPTVNELLGQIKSPFKLFKEPEVTIPAKPDYSRMERPQLIDRIELLESALASTETNVRKYMDDAKKATAALAEERRKKTPLLRFEQQAQLKTLEASREFDSKRIAELQNELHNQRTKYKIKLKECGAVIGTLKGMIKELTK